MVETEREKGREKEKLTSEIPQIILFKERGRDRTLRNEYKCRADAVPSLRVTKFVKELSRSLPSSMREGKPAGDFTDMRIKREREKEPFRRRDNISELGGRLESGRKKFSQSYVCVRQPTDGESKTGFALVIKERKRERERGGKAV